MRAHKTKKRENLINKRNLLYGFWGTDKWRWSRGDSAASKKQPANIRRNEGLGSGGIRDRETSLEASWAIDEA